jgi:hypothetical protein
MGNWKQQVAWFRAGFLLLVVCSSTGQGVEKSFPPSISILLKPALWKRALDDKEVIVNANLFDLEKPAAPNQKYSFYAAMVVGASIPQTRKVLTDYRLYSEMIPYIDKTEYFPSSKKLNLEGGVWNYRLRSQVQFEEKSDRWIHYEIIEGHFSGLGGDIFFESLGEKGTAVYLRGEQLGNHWPPRFVIERGAEIVFEFTAKRMRSYIESQKKVEKGASHEPNRQEVPQPRSHLKSIF